MDAFAFTHTDTHARTHARTHTHTHTHTCTSPANSPLELSLTVKYTSVQTHSNKSLLEGGHAVAERKTGSDAPELIAQHNSAGDRLSIRTTEYHPLRMDDTSRCGYTSRDGASMAKNNRMLKRTSLDNRTMAWFRALVMTRLHSKGV